MYIELKNVNKTFGDFQASKDVSFGVEKGRLVALLGPSGSGKTTILRMLAGLERQDDGDIFIDGKLVNDVSVQDREIGFVFQSYALFPYLTVAGNIAYGMKSKKKSKQEIKEKVDYLLNLVGLPGLESRYPNQLSGGQRQRVAFARALATEPHLLLLDEPFAAIDAKVRKELRRWLKELVGKVGVTSIFVTHDQDEAVEVADEIIITNEGRIEQIGTPVDVYRNPQTPFVAQFIGESVILKDYAYEKIKGMSKIKNSPMAAIRPEFVKVSPAGADVEYPNACMDGVVRYADFRGSSLELAVEVDGLELKAEYVLDGAPLKEGDRVKVFVSRIYAFDDSSVSTVVNSSLKTDEIYYI